MKLTKKLTAIALSAALAVGSVTAGAPATAQAAETAQDQVMQLVTNIKTATDTAAENNAVKTSTDLAIELMGSKISASLEVTVDKRTGVAKIAVTNVDAGDLASLFGSMLGGADMSGAVVSVSGMDGYIDMKSNVVYAKNDDLGRYELENIPVELTQSLLSTTISPDMLTKYGSLMKFGEMTTSTVDGKSVMGLPINVALEGDQIKTLSDSVTSMIPNYDASAMDIASIISKVDVTVTPYVDIATNLIVQTTEKGTINANFMGVPVEVKVDATSKNSLSTESLTIPDDVINNAQIAAGYTTSNGGVDFMATLSGKNAVLTVTGVSKKSATKLTIPASVSEYGKDYKVTKVASKAFKSAKKLKTLVVKNAKLKKAIKKNPTKYGLKKTVKIK